MVRFGVKVLLVVPLLVSCRTVPSSTPAVATAPYSVPANYAAVDGPPLPHQTFTLTSRILHEVRRINIYTPPGYAAHPSARYPVLYMPDGGIDEDFRHVTKDIDTAVRQGRMRPMIVVGIENTERRRDMTGPTSVASDRKIAPHVGGAAAFRAFIRDELMPEIARRVRGDGRTAIVGESLAGLFVMEIFFAQPKMFDTYIALSPSLWWNDGALVRHAAEGLKAHPDLHATLYIGVASDDGLEPSARQLEQVFRADAPKGLRWYVERWPKLKHATIYRGASPSVFRKLFPPAARAD